MNVFVYRKCECGYDCYKEKMRAGIYTYLCKYSSYSYFYMSKLWNACFIIIDIRVLV